MSLPDSPEHAHFAPDYNQYTERLVVGPKFLASLFFSECSNDQEAQKHEFGMKLIRLIEDKEIAYRDIRVNQHVLDEAATHLKDKHSRTDAFRCVRTVRNSELFTIDSVSDTAYTDACQRFVEYTDHDGAFTDFVTAAYLEEQKASYLVTWDSHYRAFEDVLLLPYCAHS